LYYTTEIYLEHLDFPLSPQYVQFTVLYKRNSDFPVESSACYQLLLSYSVMISVCKYLTTKIFAVYFHPGVAFYKKSVHLNTTCESSGTCKC